MLLNTITIDNTQPDQTNQSTETTENVDP